MYYINATIQLAYQEKKNFYLTEGLLFYGIQLYKTYNSWADLPLKLKIEYDGGVGLLFFEIYDRQAARIKVKAEYYKANKFIGTASTIFARRQQDIF
jgi:hypothetical protein